MRSVSHMSNEMAKTLPEDTKSPPRDSSRDNGAHLVDASTEAVKSPLQASPRATEFKQGLILNLLGDFKETARLLIAISPEQEKCLAEQYISSEGGIWGMSSGYSSRQAVVKFKEMALLSLFSDRSRCYLCLSRLDSFVIDHVFPATKGGVNHIGNLAMVCRRCNGRKSSRLVLTSSYYERHREDLEALNEMRATDPRAASILNRHSALFL